MFKLSQINWIMYSNKFEAQDISWLQGSGTGLSMDLLLTGCPCVWVSVYVIVCAWACMCKQWANVKPRTDRNLASVLCPGELDSEVFEELLSQQMKARYNYSFPCCQGTCKCHTVLFLTFTAGITVGLFWKAHRWLHICKNYVEK